MRRSWRGDRRWRRRPPPRNACSPAAQRDRQLADGYALLLRAAGEAGASKRVDAISTSAICTRRRASGARDDRPGPEACTVDLRDCDVLLVCKLDRLGRSLSHLIRIVEGLQRRGVAFRSLTEVIDTTSVHGSFLFNLLATLAAYERARITARVDARVAARIDGRIARTWWQHGE